MSLLKMTTEGEIIETNKDIVHHRWHRRCFGRG
jgi:hypothetical protein